MKDIVVVGAGPAGITASIYLARQNINFKIITENIGGQAALSSQIENYTGFMLIPGRELIDMFYEHAKNFGITIDEGVRVEKVEKIDEGFKIFSSKGSCCEARAILVVSGARPRRLEVPGEKKFTGKGVAYCATCDAPIFSGKDVAVVGGGNSALDAARQLKDLAHKVYLITIEDKLRGETVIREKVIKSPNVEVITNANVKEIFGNKMVRGIKYDASGSEKEIELQGVFVEIGWVPSSDFIEVDKNDKGEIIIDLNNKTSREGIFAAGDVTNISKKQVIIAAGAGAKAALNAIEYISYK